MNDLVALLEFLRARIAEDEKIARAAAPGPWHMDENQRIYAEDGAYVTAPWTDDERDDDLDHMVHQDPARALREIAAKRGIIDRYAENAAEPWPLFPLLEIATVYAGHPEFREEWKP